MLCTVDYDYIKGTHGESYLQVYTYIQGDTHVCVNLIHACMHTHMNIRTYAHMYAHTHEHMHARTH